MLVLYKNDPRVKDETLRTGQRAVYIHGEISSVWEGTYKNYLFFEGFGGMMEIHLQISRINCSRVSCKGKKKRHGKSYMSN